MISLRSLKMLRASSFFAEEADALPFIFDQLRPHEGDSYRIPVIVTFDPPPTQFGEYRFQAEVRVTVDGETKMTAVPPQTLFMLEE